MKKPIKEETGRPAVSENLAEIGLPLEEMIRRGARKIIQQAIEVEVQVLTSSYAHVTTTGGQQVVVRNGYLPERDILTAAGPVAVKVPKVVVFDHLDRRAHLLREEINIDTPAPPPRVLRRRQAIAEAIKRHQSAQN